MNDNHSNNINLRENNFTGYLGEDFQRKVFWQILTELDFADRTIPLLEVNYFDNPTYKRLFSIIKAYYNEYSKPPLLQNKTIDIALNKFTRKNDVTELELLNEVINQIRIYNDTVLNGTFPFDGDVVKKETETFILQQEYRKLADFINTKIRSGDSGDEVLTSIGERIKIISEIGAEEDLGIEVMENIERALTAEFRRPVPTGILAVDYLTNGGLGAGEIGVILAPSGVGKSTILTKIANTAYQNGLNVLQIIFEDKDDAIRRKHFTLWSGIPLSEIDTKTDEVREKIMEWHKKNTFGRLIIKKFSQDGTTIPKIRQYIDRYQKKTGIKFDIVVLDYIDVVESHKKSTDQNREELDIIKSFEAMADEYDIPCWTAIQTGRGGFGAEFIDTGQMGGSIKRAQKTHFLMSIAKTQDQKEAGLANMSILKARFAQDGQVFKDCIFNNDTMEIRVTDEYIKSKYKKEIIKNAPDNDKELERLERQFNVMAEDNEMSEEELKAPSEPAISIGEVNIDAYNESSIAKDITKVDDDDLLEGYSKAFPQK
jgi:nucleoside-triphosphatase THEP1